jgi:hypothetical protein
MTRYITLPGPGVTVTLGQYVKAVKLAIANPTVEFKHGLTCWYSCSGADIRRQFRQGMQDRINQAIPAIKRGLK